MMHRAASLALNIALGAVVVCSSLLALSAQAQSKGAAQNQNPGATSAKELDYAGADTCKACHEDIYKGWEKSPHWKQSYKEGGLAKHGCEDCHGAGVRAGRGALVRR